MKVSPHFDSKEFACKDGCGFDTPDIDLVEGLERLRKLCGNKPIYINSACRCAYHNKVVRGSPNSQHVKGKAADLRLPEGLTVDEFAQKAEEAGFTGIGKYKTFVHVDVRPNKARWDQR